MLSFWTVIWGLLAIGSTLLALRPGWRERVKLGWGRRGRGGPVSTLSCVAWTLYFLSLAVVESPIWAEKPDLKAHNGIVLGAGFFLILAAAIYDAERSR